MTCTKGTVIYQYSYKSFTKLDIVSLHRGNLPCYLPGIIAVEQEVTSHLGLTFSEEVWKEENFTYEIPGKWLYSFVSVADCEVYGYLIASTTSKNLVHLNRVATLPQSRGQGVGKALIEQLHYAAAANNNNGISLFVNVENERAISFYRQMGYIYLDEQALFEFLRIKGKESGYRNDRVILSDQNTSFVLFKDLKYQN